MMYRSTFTTYIYRQSNVYVQIYMYINIFTAICIHYTHIYIYMHLLSVLIADWQISPEGNPESRPKLRIETGPSFWRKTHLLLEAMGHGFVQFNLAGFLKCRISKPPQVPILKSSNQTMFNFQSEEEKASRYRAIQPSIHPSTYIYPSSTFLPIMRGYPHVKPPRGAFWVLLQHIAAPCGKFCSKQL